MRSAIGRTSWSSALACASCSRGDELGHDRVERGREERLARAVDGDQDARRATARARRSSASIASAAAAEQPRDVGREHHMASVRAGRSATPPTSRNAIVGTVIAMPTMPIAVGRVAQLVDLPRERDEERAVAEQRDAHAAPQQAEVAVAQRREEAARGDAAGAVERLVAMVHRSADRAGRPRRPARRSASIGRANRKPWPRSQPSARRRVGLLGHLDALGDDLERRASRRGRRPRWRGCATRRVEPSRRNERSILRMSTGKRLR